MEHQFADSLGATRVVDPVLTNVARGYRHAMHAFSHLFPFVMVGQRAGRIVEFGAEDFAEFDLYRAPGAARQRLNVGHDSDPYALRQRAVDGVLPFERMQEANAVPGINLGRRTSAQSLAFASLQVELQASGMATSAANYSADNTSALAGAARWNHGDSRPSAAVKKAKERIRVGVGMEPNVLVIGVEVFDALQENADVIDRIKHTRGPSDDPITEALLAGYFGVDKVVVGRARKGKPGAFEAVWGKNAILAYVGVSSMDAAEADMGAPSFGYTYRLEGYPMVGEPWQDRTCDSWISPVTVEDEPVIAGADAGYLFRTVVS